MHRVHTLLSLLLPLPLLAQQPAAKPSCATPEFRAFDYWVGEWDVYNQKGTKVAESSIKRVAEGCAVSEEWRPIGGKQGVSISWYDPRDSQWHQQWVGGGGWIAWFDGNPVDGVMTLTAKADAQGNISRMTYTQPGDGVVRQTVLQSTDSGKTWTPNFVGDYKRRS